MQTHKKASKTVELRAAEEADAEQIFALYADVFGATYTERIRKRWNWALRDNLAPESNPKWVLVNEDKVVGFLAAMPMVYSVDGERVVAHTPCDYMVHENYRFHGIKLMKQFFAECPNAVTCDDIEATIKVTQWLGAKEIGPVTTHMKLLNGHALVGRGRFARMPRFAFSVFTQALKATDAVLFFRTKGVTLEQVSASDVRFDRLFERLSQDIPALLAKDARFLDWRYGDDSPQSSSEIVAAVGEDGEFQGYAVLNLVTEPRPSGYVLDLQAIRSDGFEIEKALLKYATKRFRQMGALTMRFHSIPSPFSMPQEKLKRFGFRTRNNGRRILMAKLEDERLGSIAKEAFNWRYSLGDAEVSHSLG